MVADQTNTAEIEMTTCRRCGFDVDPSLASDGMHPDCKTESYRRNQR